MSNVDVCSVCDFVYCELGETSVRCECVTYVKNQMNEQHRQQHQIYQLIS